MVKKDQEIEENLVVVGIMKKILSIWKFLSNYRWTNLKVSKGL